LQHFLNFLPLPQGQLSFLPIFIIDIFVTLLASGVKEKQGRRQGVGHGRRQGCCFSDLKDRLVLNHFVFALVNPVMDGGGEKVRGR
jgi:hypothetical protein